MRRSAPHSTVKFFRFKRKPQTAVQNEPDLDDKTKAKALKHLESLAQLGNDRSDSTLQEKAETAWDALTGILGKTIKLAPIVETVLPQIQTLLGF